MFIIDIQGGLELVVVEGRLFKQLLLLILGKGSLGVGVSQLVEEEGVEASMVAGGAGVLAMSQLLGEEGAGVGLLLFFMAEGRLLLGLVAFRMAGGVARVPKLMLWGEEVVELLMG